MAKSFAKFVFLENGSLPPSALDQSENGSLPTSALDQSENGSLPTSASFGLFTRFCGLNSQQRKQFQVWL